MTNRTYQVIFTFPGTQHPDVCSVMAGSPHDAKTEVRRTMNRYGFPPVVLNVLSVIVAGTAEAGQALLAAQALQDIVDAKAALKSQSKATLDQIMSDEEVA